MYKYRIAENCRGRTAMQGKLIYHDARSIYLRNLIVLPICERFHPRKFSAIRKGGNCHTRRYALNTAGFLLARCRTLSLRTQFASTKCPPLAEIVHLPSEGYYIAHYLIMLTLYIFNFGFLESGAKSGTKLASKQFKNQSKCAIIVWYVYVKPS